MRIWRQAQELAAQTPPQRNRYVDFLRAASILVVIFGHWLITTVYYVDGRLSISHLFSVQPAIQWMTWAFQVMPVFFIVGGYANAVSLESARRKGTGYTDWLAGRLHRLLIPLLFLILCWAGIALVMLAFHARPEMIQFASQAALIPTWFLAIYVMVVILAPPMHALWRRLGFVSFLLLVAVAVSMDLLFFVEDVRWPSWSNYFWVWLAIHNLGFAWRDGSPRRVPVLLLVAVLSIVALWLQVFPGPYPLAMVGSPDMTQSNTTPPKITLITLGLFQFGLLLALEKPVRRALASPHLWTVTVLINSMIMTIYLWHVTIMIVFIGVLDLAGGAGLGIEPGTLDWWLTRPLWIVLLSTLLLPLALLLSALERLPRVSAAAPAAWRQILGAAMICLGIALLALFGFGGGPVPRLDFAAFGLILVGAAVSGLLSDFKWAGAGLAR